MCRHICFIFIIIMIIILPNWSISEMQIALYCGRCQKTLTTSSEFMTHLCFSQYKASTNFHQESHPCKSSYHYPHTCANFLPSIGNQRALPPGELNTSPASHGVWVVRTSWREFMFSTPSVNCEWMTIKVDLYGSDSSRILGSVINVMFYLLDWVSDILDIGSWILNPSD